MIKGDWGLGIGDWGLGPIPNPQSPFISLNIDFIFIYKYSFINKVYIFIRKNIFLFILFIHQKKNLILILFEYFM